MQNYLYPLTMINENLDIRYSLIMLYAILILFFAIYKKNNLGIEKIMFKRIIFGGVIFFTTFIFFTWNKLIDIRVDSILREGTSFILELEPAIVAIMVMLTLYALAIKNKSAYLNFIKKFIAISIYVITATLLFTGEVTFYDKENILQYAIAGIIFTVLHTITFTDKKETSEQNIDQPINKEEDLFTSRKRKLAELNQIVEENLAGGTSICISGDWGIGKTSFVNAFKDQTKNYDYIMINTLEVDNSESLISYFFAELEKILKYRGYYTGISSEYEELVLLAANSNSFAKRLLKKMRFHGNEYRKNRDKINNFTKVAFEDNPVIVIVDDIERCKKEMASEILFFIKEVATMPGVISIFLSDMNEFTKKIEEKDGFFDKFFDFRIDLLDVNSAEIINYFDNIKNEKKKAIEEIKKLNKYGINANLADALNKINENIDEMISLYAFKISKITDEKDKKDEDIKKLEKYNKKIIETEHLKSDFEKIMQNPRNVIRTIKYINTFCKSVNGKYNIVEPNKIAAYAKTIFLYESIVLLAILKVIDRERYLDLENINSKKYLEALINDKIISKDSIAVTTLMMAGFWIHRDWFLDRGTASAHVDEEYKINKTLKFVNVLLKEPDELINIIDGFTSVENEYAHLLQANNFEEVFEKNMKLGNNTDELVDMFSYQYDNTDGNTNLLIKVFEYYKWKLDKEIKENKNARKEIQFNQNLLKKEYLEVFFSDSEGITQYWQYIFPEDMTLIISNYFIDIFVIFKILFHFGEQQDKKGEPNIISGDVNETLRRYLEWYEIPLSDKPALQSLKKAIERGRNKIEDSKCVNVKQASIKNIIKRAETEWEELAYFSELIEHKNDRKNEIYPDRDEINNGKFSVEYINKMINYFDNYEVNEVLKKDFRIFMNRFDRQEGHWIYTLEQLSKLNDLAIKIDERALYYPSMLYKKEMALKNQVNNDKENDDE